MTYIIATTNMKGGVGKTTLTVNLGASLAKDHGKRVLVVDLDTQKRYPESGVNPGICQTTSRKPYFKIFSQPNSPTD